MVHLQNRHTYGISILNTDNYYCKNPLCGNNRYLYTKDACEKIIRFY